MHSFIILRDMAGLADDGHIIGQFVVTWPASPATALALEVHWLRVLSMFTQHVASKTSTFGEIVLLWLLNGARPHRGTSATATLFSRALTCLVQITFCLSNQWHLWKICVFGTKASPEWSFRLGRKAWPGRTPGCRFGRKDRSRRSPKRTKQQKRKV